MRILAVSLLAVVVGVPALRAQQAGGSIDVPAGASVVLQATGDGVQIYSCTDAAGGAKWVLTGPDAKLVDATGKAIGSHFAGPTWKLEDARWRGCCCALNLGAPRGRLRKFRLCVGRRHTAGLHRHLAARQDRTPARR